MVKTIVKFLLSIILFSILLILSNAIFPFSQGFRELNSSEDPLALLFLFVISGWSCFAIFFVIKHTEYNGIKLFLNLIFVIFFVQYFLTQIETLFFQSFFPISFTVLTQFDIFLIMLSGLLPILGAVLLLVKFFQNKNTVIKTNTMNITEILIKLGIIGIIYIFVYYVFGYFVAWQFVELRLFYSGSTEKLSFFEQMFYNIKINPLIIPFQIIRGIIFGLTIIPIRNMLNKSKNVFIISVCLIYLCSAIMLIIPNPLFPDIVRIAHLIEMSSSMLLFGIIVGLILWKKKEAK
jgi:hypothetical protein